MKKPNFKVGEVVVMVHNTNNHGFRIGQKVVIKSIHQATTAVIYYHATPMSGYKVSANKIVPNDFRLFDKTIRR